MLVGRGLGFKTIPTFASGDLITEASATDLGSWDQSLSMDDAGTRLAVGDYQANKIYVYSRSGETWSLEQAISPSDSGAAIGKWVSISGDGTRIAAGPDGADSVDSKYYVYVFSRSGTTWSEEQRIDRGVTNQTYSVDLDADGNALHIGAGTVSNRYSRSGTTWSYVDQVSAGTTVECVSCNSDGTIVAMGVPTGGSGKGRVVVGTYSGSWSTVNIDPPTTSTYGSWGNVVSLSANGLTILIGDEDFGTTSPAAQKGRYTIYEDSSGWTSKITAGYSGYWYLASSVALSGDGTVALVGERWYNGDVSASDPEYHLGAYHTIIKTGGSWAASSRALDGRLDSGDTLGVACAIDSTGTYMAVSAPGYTKGAVGIYKLA